MSAMILPLLLLLGATEPRTRLLDGLERVVPWQARASDGVSTQQSLIAGHDGKALRLDYDFNDVSGYAFARRALSLKLPENYQITFWVRAEGGINDFQFKLVDASGDNVWWYNRPNAALPDEWQKITVKRRQIEFAWGPTADKTLREAAAIEFVVNRGRDGGKGAIEIDRIEITELPAMPATFPEPKLSAKTGDARLAMDGDPATAWSGQGALDIDFGGPREFGGLELNWASGAAARRYSIAFSDDGRQWRTVREVTDSNGDSDPIALPESETRHLRIMVPDRASLAEIAVKPLAWAETPNAFIASIAKQASRGTFPRSFHGEQSYWTLVGSDGGSDSGLISEDGAIEVAKGGFSIEPFIIDSGKRLSWADVAATQSLEDGYLPIPHVLWTAPGWTLDTSIFADTSGKRRLMARYALTNHTDRRKTLRLVLAVRPFQVNPPSQFLSQRGGVSPITSLVWADGRLDVAAPPSGHNPARHISVQPLVAPTKVVMAGFDAGGALDNLDRPMVTELRDPMGLVSAALIYEVTLGPGETTDVPVVIPFAGTGPQSVTAAEFTQSRDATAAVWRDKLNRVTIMVPPAKQVLADTVRSSLAHILMSRDGPMLKPGTRSYNRSWIRDGAMISDGLLRLGQSDVVRDYARWYAPYLFENGKVPCCVDFRGADPVPENDSHGEFIYLITQLYHFTGDLAELERSWPKLLAAQRYMEKLRQSERTPANLAPDRRMLFGLMPPSISHEAYSAKAQYSLWDDFWALRGYKDAAFVAETLGKSEATEIARQRDEFRRELHTAIGASVVHWKIDYIPGATSLGDFDATSTTIALDAAGEQARLDQRLLTNTFERYWRDFLARRDGQKLWKDYVPYELRTVSSFIRLGWRDRIDTLLDFFFADRRPGAWNQWAELVGKDPREVRFIGDMPHAWVSSDYIRAALDMFAYERPDEGSIVLGAGLSEAYLAGEGSAVRGLFTAQGMLDLAIRGTTQRLDVTIGGTARPRGGYVLPWPFAGTPGRTTVNGKPARWRGNELHVPAGRTPIRIEVRR